MKPWVSFRALSSAIVEIHGPIAQLDRASDYESEGRAFESLWVHQNLKTVALLAAVFLHTIVLLFKGYFMRTPADVVWVRPQSNLLDLNTGRSDPVPLRVGLS